MVANRDQRPPTDHSKPSPTTKPSAVLTSPPGTRALGFRKNSKGVWCHEETGRSISTMDDAMIAVFATWLRAVMCKWPKQDEEEEEDDDMPERARPCSPDYSCE